MNTAFLPWHRSPVIDSLASLHDETRSERRLEMELRGRSARAVEPVMRWVVVACLLGACGTNLLGERDGGTVVLPDGRVIVDADRPDIPIAPPPSPLDDTCATALTGPFEATLPAPADVILEPDDHAVHVRWGGSLASDDHISDAIEGYRICWGTSESTLSHAALFTERAATVLGVPNDVPLVLVVQAVDQRGRVSPPSAVLPFMATRARVDRLRAEMTGFFDDFDQPQGALDELRWNTAFSECNDPTVSHTFVTELGTAASLLGNHSYLPGSVAGCDRNQNIARPRAVFDFTGREGRITFDFDGADGNRSTWYLDVFPYSSQADLADITAHVSFDPAHGHPGRFLRFSQAGSVIRIHQYDGAGNFINERSQDLYWDFPDQRLFSGQTMRHWELRVSRERAAIYIDGVLVLENDAIALDFERSYVHWSQFGYNPTKVGRPWNRFNWDNFGFDGPRSPIVTHNYKTSFSIDDMMYVSAGAPVTWTVQIPDSRAGASRARFMYTIQTHDYAWDPSDRIVVNGSYTIPLPEPTSPSGSWRAATIAHRYTPFSTQLEIPLDVLRTGENTFELHAFRSNVLNPHVEIDFDDGNAPAYTPPSALLRTPPSPALMAIGPTAVLNQIGEHIVTSGEDPLFNLIADYGAAEGGSDDRLYIDTPLRGVVDIYAVVELSRARYAWARNLGITRVQLLIDGAVVASADTAATVAAPEIYDGPFEWNQPHPGGIPISLDTTRFSNGVHALEIVAYDSQGTRGRPGYDTPAPFNGAGPDHRAPIEITIQN
jgi:hypothetical protein